MDALSTSHNSSIEKPKDKLVHIVDEGLDSWNEPKGYRWWWEVQTMYKKTYIISEAMKHAIAKSDDKFIQMPKGELVATHQITSIIKKTEGFGGRAGEA